MKQRLNYLDQIRGVLLIVMIVYHYLFNLQYFFGFQIDLQSFPLVFIPPIFSSFFLAVSGFSANLSDKTFTRGLVVFFWAIIITLATFFAIPEAPITFGILHCIGALMLLSVFFKKLSSAVLALMAIVIFLLDAVTSNITTTNPFLFPLGIITPSYRALDFYPLIPHAAFFLVGMIIGRQKEMNRQLLLVKNKIGGLISLLGRHSLKVYLIHQPLFFLFYYIFFSSLF